VAGGIALQAVAMTSLPRLTNDFYRYAWDGRVQAAGISPYRYAPTDDALTQLRTPWLFPPTCTAVTAGIRHVCTRMNHPVSPTIYPPVAQAEFLAVHVLTRPLGPDGGRDRTWQALAALLATATTVALLRLLRLLRGRGDPRQAVLWAWCPTVVIETGGNAHVDVLASLLVVLAMSAVVARHQVRAGVLIGLAVATKLLPVLALIPMLGPRRRFRGALLSAAGTTVRWSTCRTCWRSARGCSGSCRDTCRRRATTGAPGSHCCRYSCPDGPRPRWDSWRWRCSRTGRSRR
jgi:hypothetical protein